MTFRGIRISPPLAILLGALALTFPALLNGSPYLFHDSDGYYRGGRSVISVFFEKHKAADVDPGAQPSATAASSTPKQNYAVTLLAARSVYYGTLLYLTATVAGLWGIVAIQALIASFVLWRTAGAFAAGRRAAAFAAMLATTAFASSLPWFVSFAMPDVWLSFAVVFLCIFVFGSPDLALIDYALLALIVVAAATFHLTNIPLILLSTLVAGPIAVFFGVQKKRVFNLFGTVAIGLVLAIMAGWIFNTLAARHFGDKLRTPIFATARLLADGPGRNYLRDTCAVDPSRYVLCKFQKLPLDNADDILWSSDPSRGVYTVSDYGTRIALADEQSSFVMRTILAHPAQVLVAAAKNTLDQLRRFGIYGEFTDNVWAMWSGRPFWSELAIFEVIPNAGTCLKLPATCSPPRYAKYFDKLARAVFIASTIFLLFHIWRYGTRHSQSGDANQRLAGFGATVILVLLFNAAICGAFSGAHNRYQARLIWIVPALAALIVVVNFDSMRGVAGRKGS